MQKYFIIEYNEQSAIILRSENLYSEPIKLIQLAVLPNKTEQTFVYLNHWEIDENNNITLYGTTNLNFNAPIFKITGKFVEIEEKLKKRRNCIWKNGYWEHVKTGKKYPG